MMNGETEVSDPDFEQDRPLVNFTFLNEFSCTREVSLIKRMKATFFRILFVIQNQKFFPWRDNSTGR